MELEPGTVFADYTVVRLIGVGGMGSVYLMRHPRLPMDVAVKVLDSRLGRDPRARARFEREAEIAAELQHPNIVRVVDRGVEGQIFWLAMEFVDGLDGAQLLAQGPIPVARCVDIVVQAARGLDYAHERGVAHRDVKPANLLIETQHGTDRVQIADFGIARGLDNTVTMTTSVTATFSYAAPELLSGGPADHRVDVYAFGCTLYHLLTDATPFPMQDISAVMFAHMHTPPPRVTDARPEVPAGLDGVIAKAMAKDPADRFPTCGELAAAAQMALTEPGRSMPTAVASGGSPTGPRFVESLAESPIEADRPIKSETPSSVSAAPVSAGTPPAGVRRRRRVTVLASAGAAVAALAAGVGFAVDRTDSGPAPRADSLAQQRSSPGYESTPTTPYSDGYQSTPPYYNRDSTPTPTTPPYNRDATTIPTTPRYNRDTTTIPTTPRYNRDTTPAPTTPVHAARRATIDLVYSGDLYGCAVHISVQIGDQTAVPSGSRYRMSGILAGAQQYTIQGTIACSKAPSCTASGRGTITVVDSASYAVMWRATASGYCTVALSG